MVCVQVHGATAAVGFAGSQGNFQLNVYKPVIIYNFLHSVTLITDACHGYVEYMLKGMEVDRAKVHCAPEELPDAGDCPDPEDWIRQGSRDRPHRSRRSQQPARGGVEAWVSHGRRVRSTDEARKNDAAIESRVGGGSPTRSGRAQLEVCIRPPFSDGPGELRSACPGQRPGPTQFLRVSVLCLGSSQFSHRLIALKVRARRNLVRRSYSDHAHQNQ